MYERKIPSAPTCGIKSAMDLDELNNWGNSIKPQMKKLYGEE